MLREGPAVGEGAVETFDFSVGLRSVGAGLLRPDAEFVAGIAPGVGLVGGAVVGEDPFDGDAVGGEPGDGSAQHSDRGGRGFVVVDLGIGDAGVVVDDGVHERMSHEFVVVLAACQAGSRSRVLASLLAANETPPTAVWDVAEFLDVDVDQRTRGFVLVAGSPVFTSTCDSRFRRHRTRTA